MKKYEVGDIVVCIDEFNNSSGYPYAFGSIDKITKVNEELDYSKPPKPYMRYYSNGGHSDHSDGSKIRIATEREAEAYADGIRNIRHIGVQMNATSVKELCWQAFFLNKERELRNEFEKWWLSTPLS